MRCDCRAVGPRMLAVLAFALAAVALSLCACSSNAGGEGGFTDAYGRSVSLPQEVETVATVGSGARFVVYAGAQDKLIAVTDMDKKNTATMPYTLVYAEEFAKLPSTSNGAHLNETSVDVEKLMALAPSIIVSSRSAQECDALQEQTGIPVVGISYQNQLFTEEVYTSIEVVGRACGTSEHAQAVVNAMKGWASDLDARTATVKDGEKPTAYVGAINYKGSKGFAGTFAKYAPLEAVHGLNVADELGDSGSYEIDIEQLGAWDPDVIFLNMANAELLMAEYEKNPSFFNALKAFKGDSIYSQPSFNFNGTNVEVGIADAYFCGSVLYPGQFADVDLAKMYDEIFETMLGKECYASLQASGVDFAKVDAWSR